MKTSINGGGGGAFEKLPFRGGGDRLKVRVWTKKLMDDGNLAHFWFDSEKKNMET
jgi:hypothetical protein